jgi:ATP-binding cassette subfamily B protein
MRSTGQTDFNLYRRLLRQARPYWAHIGLIFVLNLLGMPLALLTPIPLKIAVDSVIGSEPLPPLLSSRLSSGFEILVFAVVLLVGLALLRQLQELASSLMNTYTGERLVLAFRAELFRHVQRLSLSYHDIRGAADAVYRIQWDTPSIQHIAIDGLMPFITSGLTVVAMIYVTARIDWVLSLVALVIAPVLFLLTRWYRRPLRGRYSKVKEIETSSLSVIQEVLSAIRVVKAFGKEDYEHERFVSRSSEGMRARIRLALFQAGFDLFVGLTTATGTALVLFVGIRHVQTGVITLGELLVVMAYLALLYAPLRTISNKAADIQASLASAERAFKLLDEQPDVAERADALSISQARGAIAFRQVHFTYDKDHPILRDVSFEITPGTRVGIAGPTGAGKTTLVSLLMRFYDPVAGQITLDGIDLRDYKLADLRNQFSMVLQDPVLFSTSIAENIAYARPDASEEEIIDAARAANAHTFICNLPDGFDTQVGDRGMRLSGGERQRISLARAFLKDAPILILDEPTSSVDLKTEAGIMEAMERLMSGRTTFMIAHRLSTLENCDVRLELDQGRLAASSGLTLGDRQAALV